MLKNDAIVFHEPTELVRKSGRVPKTLKFTDPSTKDDYWIEPIIEGEMMETAKIFYEMPMKFARILLGNDKRFLLCTPNRLVVQVYDAKVFGRKSKILKACGEMPKPEDAIDDAKLEDAFISRVDKENEELETLESGKVPKHMKKDVEKLKVNNKAIEKQANENLQKRLSKQADSEKGQRKGYKVGKPEITTL